MRKAFEAKIDVAQMDGYPPQLVTFSKGDGAYSENVAATDLACGLGLSILKEVWDKVGELHVVNDGKTITVQHLVPVAQPCEEGSKS